MPKKIKEANNENESKVVKPVPTSVQTSTPKQDVQMKADQMKANLDKQNKVTILIPLEKGEKKGAVQPFCINGYRFTVPKGTMTQVPEQVAQMISERFNVELEVRGQSLDQRDSETKTALDM